MNTQKQIFLIVVLLFVVTGGCAAYAAIDLPYRAGMQDDYQFNGRVERGALLYANNCRTCHGIKGEGGVGPTLNGTLREGAGAANFHDQSPLVLAQNQALIRRTLECGRAGTLMPAWLKDNGGALSRIQIEHLVEFLTAPADLTDAEGLATSRGWEEAVEFGHNLNAESTAAVGGDTLGSIAKSHNIGPEELLAYNPNAEFQSGETPGINALLKRGSYIRLLPTDDEPEGYRYRIRQDNETVAKIADAQSIGAILIAQENGIPFEIDRRSTLFSISDPATGEPRPGLLPGQTLALPAGATYTVVAGDTIESIATQHGIAEDELTGLNEDALGDYEPDAEINPSPVIELPEGTTRIAQEGDTLALIAGFYGLDEAELRTLNDLADDAEPGLGDVVTLTGPDFEGDLAYTIQSGDTLFHIAEVHGLTAQQLAELNGLTVDPNEALPTTITLELPEIDAYVVAGQTLEEVALGYGNVSAASLAEANGVEANSILYIGQQLRLPADAYGSAPPDALNLGTACVEHAVTAGAYLELIGQGPPEITRPDEYSDEVVITANANDWTFTVDGADLTPNGGGALVRPGTTVEFINAVGIHSVTVNDEDLVNPFNPGDTFSFEFQDEGEFDITCVFHPDMFGKVFVEAE